MNYSNPRARGKQACPSLYEPDPGARLPPSHDSASDHTTALSSFSRRAPLLLRGNVHDRRHTNSPSKLRPALPMINQSGHIGDLTLHSGVLTRLHLPELCRMRSTRHPVGGAPLRGNQHLFSHNLTESRLILHVIVHLRKVNVLTPPQSQSQLPSPPRCLTQRRWRPRPTRCLNEYFCSNTAAFSF